MPGMHVMNTMTIVSDEGEIILLVDKLFCIPGATGVVSKAEVIKLQICKKYFICNL
jgi:hypothetical protein